MNYYTAGEYIYAQTLVCIHVYVTLYMCVKYMHTYTCIDLTIIGYKNWKIMKIDYITLKE